MNRISYDGGPFNGELQQAILSGINFEIRDMCRRVKVRARRIYEVVIVGNATMRDLIFGFDVQPIGEKPYKSVTELEMLAGQRPTTAVECQGQRPRVTGIPAGQCVRRAAHQLACRSRRRC